LSVAQAQQKVVIGIPTSPPNVIHLPAIVAKDLGLYKKAPGAPATSGTANGLSEGALGQPAEVRGLADCAPLKRLPKKQEAAVSGGFLAVSPPREGISRRAGSRPS
jgi:hypothetical protein